MVEEDGDGGGDRQVFAGVHYRLFGFDECLDLEKHYKEAMEKRGGKLAVRFDKVNCTHVIIYSERIDYNNNYCTMARKLGIIVANEFWVDDSLTYGDLADHQRVFYWPVRELSGISGSLQLHISASGYSFDKLKEIQRMIHLMGASFYDNWSEKGTHLVCYEFEGEDYSLAKKCKANVVNQKWLEDCLKEWKILPVDKYTISGSQLELVETQCKGVNKQLVFNAKTHGRQYYTPQIKLSSADTRKALSTGMKRLNVPIDYKNTGRCKRALVYGSSSSSAEIAMNEYAERELTEKVKVPYMLNERKMAKEAIKLILLNAYGQVVDLHYEGKTLKGLFSSENFLISLKTKKVNLCGIEPVKYFKGDGTADKLQFIEMVKGMFGDDLPEEIKVWLDCIKNGVDNNVLRRHINMQHNNSIFGEFCVMYHALLEMKDLDKTKFRTLLVSLADYDAWVSTPFTWSILESNRQYQDPNADKTGSTSCKSNVFGLMQQIRNCWEHPAKLYKRFLMAILLVEFPKLLSDMQRQLYEAGYLPQLDIKNMD